MIYSSLTSGGLNEINSSFSEGLLIDIQYFVLSYDYRIDSNIGVTNPYFSATDIRTVTSANDTFLQGEIIWNCPESNVYSLSESEDYLIIDGNEISATSGSGVSISNYSHSNKLSINQFKSSAISQHYTANTVYTPGSSPSWFFSNTGFGITPVATTADGYGPSDPENPESSFLFKGVTYQNVIDENNESRANFKVQIRIPNGIVKFNKVGLYGVKLTSDFLVASSPFLLGQCILTEPQVLHSNVANSTSFSLSELILDYQIETKSTSGDFNDLFYSTSGHWVRTTNEQDGNYGLSYDGSVYISNTLAVDDRGNFLNTSADGTVSKLFVSTFEKVNKATPSLEQDMPQLALQYVPAATQNRIRTTFKTNSSGDCEIDLYGACSSGNNERFSVIPAIDKSYGLGTYSDITNTANRWHHLTLSDKFEMFDDSYQDLISSDSFNGFYVKVNSFDSKFNVYNGDVYCGPYFSSAMIDKTLTNKNYFYGNISSYRSSAYSGSTLEVKSYDLLLRSLNDMLLVTLKYDNADSSWATAEGIIQEIWNLKDGNSPDISDNLDTSKNIALVAGNNIYTYGNIIPLTHDRDSIGDNYKGIKKVWVNKIGYSKIDSSDSTNEVTFDSSIVGDAGMGYSVGRLKNPWGTVFTKNLGSFSGYVGQGFISTLNVGKLNVDTGGLIDYYDGLEINGRELFSEKSYNLGKNNRRISTLYVDNIVLTYTGETTPIILSLTNTDSDLYVLPLITYNNSDYFKLNLVKIVNTLTSFTTIEGTITCYGEATRTTLNVQNKDMFILSNVKSLLEVDGTLELVSPSNINTNYEDNKLNIKTSNGLIVYDETEDKLYIKQSAIITLENRKQWSVGKIETQTIKFTVG